MKTKETITTRTTKAMKAKTKETIITKANKTKTNKTKTTEPTEVYMNLLNDFGFKFIFRKKRFLIHFLNELLDGKEKIKRVQELNSERLGKTKEDRRAVFDVYCKNEKGEHILLEMQHIPQDYFLDRSIYYSSFLIQQQGKKGKWDYKLKKIYVIGILNFVPKEMRATKDYIYRVKLCDINTARVISEKLNFIYVNLPKFKKSSGKLETVMDYWLHALINSQPGREIDEKVLKKDRFFAGLLNTIRVNKLNKDEMRAYRLSERDFEDMKKNMTGYISY
ncbi:MAG: Rpn family recombination-promoting nuclease/putative transposase, partial [Bacteroidales bacterium]|nr:Rpn family recombination-promoting nuclease/putative transposase [Bacteroidales bacterium]